MHRTSVPSKADVMIRRWAGITGRDQLLPALDAIFFESSGTKTFASEADRQSFRERWLGRYLAQEPDCAYVALGRNGELAGYLVGSLGDPGKTPRVGDSGSVKDFAALTRAYPAHLHVNLSPAYRNRGIGAMLIEAFVADAVSAGSPGVHVVTGAGSRNINFYERNGFSELGRAKSNAREVVFLGRRLGASETA